MSRYTKKAVEEWLRETDYEFKGYMPKAEALLFVNFIKEVNAGSEENETPLVHLKMMDGVFNGDRRCAILCHRGIGKSQSLLSLIMTDQGWTTMKDIRVGDKVFTRKGTLATVDYKTPLQHRKMYEVELKDGTKFEVGEDHNHIVWMHRKKDREKVLTTTELLSRPLYKKTKNRDSVRTPKRQYTYSIPLVEPLQFPEADLPIEPYVMGYGIANGHYSSGTVSCHADDLAEITGLFGCPIRHSSVPVGNAGRFRLQSNPYKPYSGLKSRDKYIPSLFAKSSINQRLRLLRGLMDGDGHIAKNGGCSYSSYSKRLAYDVRDLARSLGAISYVKAYTRTDKKGATEYRTVICIKLNPFLLARKANKWRATKKISRAIINIKEIADEGSHCIHIDHPTHSYITDGFTVTHNTSLFAEYLFLFMAAFGEFPGFGKVNLALYVTDSIENGVKNLRRNVEFRYGNSDFLQKLIPNKRITIGTNGSGHVGLDTYEDQFGAGRKFTDIRLEFKNHKGHTLIVKGYGAKALSLDTCLLSDRGITTIRDCCPGERIYGPDGVYSIITQKSEIFHRPMYQIILEDGRSLKVCEEHINSVVHKENPNNTAIYVKKDLLTSEIVNIPLQHVRRRTRKNRSDYITHENLLFIENTLPIQHTEKSLPVDPYTLGLLLGDGSMKKDGSTILHAHVDDLSFYEQLIPYSFGSRYVDKRNSNVVSLTIKKLCKKTRPLGVHVHGDYKFVPSIYFFGSIDQRLALLQGLMDTDGSIQKNGRMDFCSNSKRLINNVMNLVRSLGGSAKKRRIGKAYRTEIWIGLNIFKLPRKAGRFTGTRLKQLMAITAINRIADEASQCIAIDNDDHQFLVNQYIRTHNTGVRGAKELGQRPTLAILDDLVSDTDAESATVIKTIKNTVYKAVSKALHPTRQKMIWLGTPFNAKDPLYLAVESGAWNVSVYPVCEHYPCTKEEFRGSWEDRFPYSYVKDEYDEAQDVGEPENFNQELMLKIMSEEDRLIRDSDIRYYKHRDVVRRRAAYNCYITTDFAVTKEDANDFSVISVWLLNNKGYWYWVDGICKKQLMDKNLDDLFRLAQKWNPLSVGIEVSGQQGGFIPWIEKEMITRNIFFLLATENNKNNPGIRPITNKMVRFNGVVPWFKMGMFYFPSELLHTEAMLECMDELQLASKSGFKSKHDDFLDTISMLSVLVTCKPSESVAMVKTEDDVWEVEEDEFEHAGAFDSYIV